MSLIYPEVHPEADGNFNMSISYTKVGWEGRITNDESSNYYSKYC